MQLLDVLGDRLEFAANLVRLDPFVDERVALVLLRLVFERVRLVLGLLQDLFERARLGDVPPDRILLLQVPMSRF